MNRRLFLRFIMKVAGVAGLARMGLLGEAHADGLILGWPASGGPTNLLTNGNFTTDASGWTYDDGWGGAGGGGWEAPGVFKIANGSNATLRQNIVLLQDVTYNFSVDVIARSGTPTLYFQCDDGNSTIATLTTANTYTGTFTPVVTTVFVRLLLDGPSPDYIIIDNVSITP